MPQKRNAKRKPRRKAQPYGPPIGRRPKMIRTLRVAQNLTRDCRWFKSSSSIVGSDDGTFKSRYAPVHVNECLDFLNWGKCWEEYKVLQIIIHFYPVAVGSESLQENVLPTPPATGHPGYANTFKRGNVITYQDQGDQDTDSLDFLRLITKPSAKLVSARAHIKRWLTRPKGHPLWGKFSALNGAVLTPDSWNDSWVTIQGEEFTPDSRPGRQGGGRSVSCWDSEPSGAG